MNTVWILLILVLGLPISAQTPSARPAERSLSEPAQTQTSLNWSRRPAGRTGITAELPTDPDPAEMNVRDEVRRQIKRLVAAKASFGGVIARFSHVEYHDAMGAELGRAAEDAVRSLRNTTGISDVKSRSEETRVNGLRALRVEASYQYQGSPVSFIAVIVGEGGRMWQASVIYRTASEEQERVARRVIDSVRIDP